LGHFLLHKLGLRSVAGATLNLRDFRGIGFAIIGPWAL